MRILILSSLYPSGFIGGYELGAAEIANGLQAAGHQVEVLTSNFTVDDSGGDLGANGMPVVHRGLDYIMPSMSPQEDSWQGAFVIPRNLRELAGKLQALQPDAVLCFNLAGVGAPSVLRLLVATGVRPVLYMMDNVLAQFCADTKRRQDFEQVFSSADWPQNVRFLFVSQNLRDEVESTLGLLLSHSRIVPLWFDRRAEAEVVPHDDTCRFVFASHIVDREGFGILLDACRLVLDSGYADFTVDIFGSGEVPATIQRIVPLQLANHVRYVGALEKQQLMPELQNYDALLLPTLHGAPFPSVVVDAASAGSIPIMTYGIGADEWFLDGIDCFKITREPAALQAAIMRVMAMRQDERIAMRRGALAVARRFFRFEYALAKVEAALTEAIGKPSHSPRAMEAAMAVLTNVWRTRPIS